MIVPVCLLLLLALSCAYEDGAGTCDIDIFDDTFMEDRERLLNAAGWSIAVTLEANGSPATSYSTEPLILTLSGPSTFVGFLLYFENAAMFTRHGTFDHSFTSGARPGAADGCLDDPAFITHSSSDTKSGPFQFRWTPPSSGDVGELTLRALILQGEQFGFPQQFLLPATPSPFAFAPPSTSSVMPTSSLSMSTPSTTAFSGASGIAANFSASVLLQPQQVTQLAGSGDEIDWSVIDVSSRNDISFGRLCLMIPTGLEECRVLRVFDLTSSANLLPLDLASLSIDEIQVFVTAVGPISSSARSAIDWVQLHLYDDMQVFSSFRRLEQVVFPSFIEQSYSFGPSGLYSRAEGDAPLSASQVNNALAIDVHGRGDAMIAGQTLEIYAASARVTCSWRLQVDRLSPSSSSQLNSQELITVEGSDFYTSLDASSPSQFVCRFGSEMATATRLSSTALQCVLPAQTGSPGNYPFSLSVDGGLTFLPGSIDFLYGASSSSAVASSSTIASQSSLTSQFSSTGSSSFDSSSSLSSSSFSSSSVGATSSVPASSATPAASSFATLPPSSPAPPTPFPIAIDDVDLTSLDSSQTIDEQLLSTSFVDVPAPLLGTWSGTIHWPGSLTNGIIRCNPAGDVNEPFSMTIDDDGALLTTLSAPAGSEQRGAWLALTQGLMQWAPGAHIGTLRDRISSNGLSSIHSNLTLADTVCLRYQLLDSILVIGLYIVGSDTSSSLWHRCPPPSLAASLSGEAEPACLQSSDGPIVSQLFATARLTCADSPSRTCLPASLPSVDQLPHHSILLGMSETGSSGFSVLSTTDPDVLLPTDSFTDASYDMASSPSLWLQRGIEYTFYAASIPCDVSLYISLRGAGLRLSDGTVPDRIDSSTRLDVCDGLSLKFTPTSATPDRVFYSSLRKKDFDGILFIVGDSDVAVLENKASDISSFALFLIVSFFMFIF